MARRTTETPAFPSGDFGELHPTWQAHVVRWNLRRLRLAVGLSTADMARLVKRQYPEHAVSASMIGQMETGSRRMPLQMAFVLAKVLEVGFDELCAIPASDDPDAIAPPTMRHIAAIRAGLADEVTP